MIFVLLGRRNALCLARHNRAKSAEIHRFKAGSDLSLYPTYIMPEFHRKVKIVTCLFSLFPVYL